MDAEVSPKYHLSGWSCSTGYLRVEGGNETNTSKQARQGTGFSERGSCTRHMRELRLIDVYQLQATKRALNREGAGSFGVGMLHKTGRREKTTQPMLIRKK